MTDRSHDVGQPLNIGIYAGSVRPGGGLTAVEQLVSALARHPSAEVSVFTGDSDSIEALQPLVESSRAVREVPLKRRRPSTRYLASKAAFRTTDLDWLISINHYIPTSARLLVYHLNLLSFVPEGRRGLFNRIRQFDAGMACQHADLNVFESQYLADTARAAVGQVKNEALLYLGIQEAFFTPTPATHHASGELLMVSSMQPHKDNETAVRVLAELRRVRPDADWHLSIAGGQAPHQWGPLRELAKVEGVEDGVSFLGPLDKPTLAQRMSTSLCLINPSRIESFCMVALEAMASGCPAIVTNATSMPESVGDSAPVVDPGDVSGFVREVLLLKDNLDLRRERIQRGRRRAERFRLEAFSDQLHELLAL